MRAVLAAVRPAARRLSTIRAARMPDHLQCTAHEPRDSTLFRAQVIAAGPANASASVLSFLFELVDPRLPLLSITERRRLDRADVPKISGSSLGFSFLPGQWLDVHIPGVSTVGGFSFTSSPQMAAEWGQFELAVKRSEHPPAAWFHAADREGELVDVRVGGGFTYPPLPERGPAPEHAAILFIKCIGCPSCISSMPHLRIIVSGGVGINPTMSILRTIASQPTSSRPKLRLLYSSQPSELMFAMHLHGAMEPAAITLFLTGDSSASLPDEMTNFHFTDVKRRRMGRQDIEAVVRQMGAKALVYVCGPPDMTDEVLGRLQALHVPESRVLYEKWW